MSEAIKSAVLDTDEWRINMVCCTEVILNEVSHKEITQRDVALSYALAIKSQMQGADKPDWGKINRAIIARWSMPGLERIKKGAFDLHTGRATAETLMQRKRKSPA